MTTAAITERIAEVSPRRQARIAGALYAIIIVAALFAERFVRGRLLVMADAAATATNILAFEPLYRMGGAAMLITIACDTAVAVIFYELLKPVSRSLSLLAAFFRLIQVAILAINSLYHFAPLLLLKGAPFLMTFNEEQLQSLALVSLRLYARGFNVAMVFFGFSCLLIGWLIYESTFLPRALGALMAVAGFCYLINSFAVFVAPSMARHLFPYILLPCFAAELMLTLWLLVKAVNVQRWDEQASR